MLHLETEPLQVLLLQGALQCRELEVSSHISRYVCCESSREQHTQHAGKGSKQVALEVFGSEKSSPLPGTIPLTQLCTQWAPPAAQRGCSERMLVGVMVVRPSELSWGNRSWVQGGHAAPACEHS